MSFDSTEQTETSAPVIETVRSSNYGVPATREQRDQLKALSTEVFGASSKYQKFFETKELVTRKEEQPILDEKGNPLESGATQTVDVPVLSKSGLKQYRMKYRSVEEVIELLQDFKAKRDTFLAEMQAKKEAAKKKQEEIENAIKVGEQLTGSALT